MNYIKQLVALAKGEMSLVRKLDDHRVRVEETIAKAMLTTGKDKQTILNEFRKALIASGTSKQAASKFVKSYGYVTTRGVTALSNAHKAKAPKIDEKVVSKLLAQVKGYARTNAGRKALLEAVLALL
jgi:hypothetical protein